MEKGIFKAVEEENAFIYTELLMEEELRNLKDNACSLELLMMMSF